MLQAQNVSSALAKCLNSFDMHTFAVIDTNGAVIETLERKQEHDLSETNDTSESQPINAKLQTKVYAILAAELWRQSSSATWAGVESNSERLAVHELSDKQLLVLAVGSTAHPWEVISSSLAKAAENVNKVIEN